MKKLKKFKLWWKRLWCEHDTFEYKDKYGSWIECYKCGKID